MSAVISMREPRATGRNLLLQALLCLPPTPCLSVLMFHRVLAESDPLRPGEPTAAEFEARMRWVAANFAVVSLASAVRALKEDRLPKRALCITFDDGYADNHEVALPILRRFDLPAAFFISSGYIDGGCMFNDAVIEAVRQAEGPILDLQALQLGRHAVGTNEERRQAIGRILERLKYFESTRREAVTRQIVERVGVTVPTNLMMTSKQILALHGAGMLIGAHTATHPILANVGLNIACDEITRDRAQLEAITGSPVHLFAYPNGRPLRDYRREHAELVRELGFDCAVSTACGAARASDDVFQIPRFTPWDRANWRFGLRLAKVRLATSYACA